MTTTERYRQALENVLQKYQTYCDNIEWHIETNNPPEVEIKKLNIKIDAYSEIVVDLKNAIASEALASATPNNCIELVKEFMAIEGEPKLVISADNEFIVYKQVGEQNWYLVLGDDFEVSLLSQSGKVGEYTSKHSSSASKDEEKKYEWQKWSKDERINYVLGWLKNQDEFTKKSWTTEGSIFYHVAPLKFAELIERFYFSKSGKDEPQKGLRWVKASERVPKDSHQSHWRDAKTHGVLKSATAVRLMANGHKHLVEWLDESGQQTNSESNEGDYEGYWGSEDFHYDKDHKLLPMPEWLREKITRKQSTQ